MENGHEPASKRDLRESEERVLATMKQDFRESEERIFEAMRDIQTEMLKAFYNFAETNNKRLAQNEVNEVALRSRMETLERRVLEVERRLNIPPQQ